MGGKQRNRKETVMSELRMAIAELLDLANRLGPESEGLDLTDRDYTPQEMVQLRSELSRMRKGIDLVNNALARAWAETHPHEAYEDETNRWYLGRTKGKKIVDPSAFYAWLATLDADRLSKLVSAASVKVGGFDEVERSTFLDETPTNDRLSIKSTPHDLKGQ